MAKVLFKRLSTSEIENLEIEDGSLIYNYETGDTYIDYGNTRIPTGSGSAGGGSVSIGTIIPYAGETIPDGYLLCDGSAVSREIYALLYYVIGTTYGDGDGSTTFNLPNLKGRVITGLDSTQTEFDTLGETGGSKNLQEHNHQLREAEDKEFKGFVTTAYSGAMGWRVSQDSAINSGGELLYNYTKNTGTGDSGNLQPYIVLKYIIKATKEQDSSTLSESLPVGTELDFDGTSSDIPEGWEEVTNPDSYSTSEVKTNKTWTDGKPIYRKVYTVSQASTQSWTAINFSTIGLSNIDYIYFAKGSRKLESSRYVRDYDYNQNVYLDITEFKLQLGPTENPQQFTFVFEYTKTTD